MRPLSSFLVKFNSIVVLIKKKKVLKEVITTEG